MKVDILVSEMGKCSMRNKFDLSLQKINEILSAQRKQIEEKVREQEAIRKRRQVVQSIIDVQKSVQQLNELDDAINLSK